jgi:hypothetical protein
LIGDISVLKFREEVLISENLEKERQRGLMLSNHTYNNQLQWAKLIDDSERINKENLELKKKLAR